MSIAPAANDRPAVTLRTFVRRGWPLFILGIVIGLALGYVATKVQNPTYQSVATVNVTETGVGDSGQVANGRTSQGPNLDTEANLVTSTPVLTRVKTLLKSADSLTAIHNRISITVPPNSALMNIAYKTTSKAAAQTGAQAVADAYLADRKATATNLLAAQIKQIQANISKVTAALKSATKTAAKYKADSADGLYWAQQINLLNKQITSFNTTLATAQVTNVTPGTISGAATLPTRAAGPSKVLYLASGLGLGVLLGLFLAWLVSRRPTRKLRRADDVERAIGLPVIARIAALEYGQLTPASAPAAEAYRRLVNVVNATVSSGGRTVVVAGSDDTEMATTVTHNMAATLARSGEKVALLKTVASAGEPRGPQGDATYQILPSTGPRTRKVIAALRDDQDAFLLIDTPEPLKTADAQSYGATADAVVIVLRDGTPTARAQRILAEFDAVSAPVLGVVLVEVNRESSAKAITAAQSDDPYAGEARPQHGVDDAADADHAGLDAAYGDSDVDVDHGDSDHGDSDDEVEAGTTGALTAHRTRTGATSSPVSRRTLRNVDRMRARVNRD